MNISTKLFQKIMILVISKNLCLHGSVATQ